MLYGCFCLVMFQKVSRNPVAEVVTNQVMGDPSGASAASRVSLGQAGHVVTAPVGGKPMTIEIVGFFPLKIW